ncbi:RepA protein [Niallia taxi]|uniref:RepA protein n=1 Tax=Niallia taxi TaxID=2499688 RepID=UPI0039828F3A
MFIQAKKKREELQLPILHYAVADDWIDKLGNDAFVAWLKFHTWVNRSDEAKSKNMDGRIPYTLEKVAEKLGCGKKKLYQKIIHPLWEYGLIDLVEYSESNRSSQKPINIIPYDYPQNNKHMETQELVKCRNWVEDYKSAGTFYGKQGGRGNKKTPIQFLSKNDGFQMETVDGFQIETVTVSEKKPINDSNNSINNSNIILIEEEGLTHENLYHALLESKVDPLVAKAIVKLSKENKVNVYSYEVKEQLKQMYYEIEVLNKPIENYPFYFLNGIIMKRPQRKSVQLQKELISEYERRQESKDQPQGKEPVKPVFYNWLEN